MITLGNLTPVIIVCYLLSACRANVDASAGVQLKIARTEISESDLGAAMKQLNAIPREPARFWSNIANDSRYPDFHRRDAVIQFFKRHVEVGLNLSDLVDMLDHPTWLRPDDIEIVDVAAGKIPVQMDLQSTVCVIRILPKQNNISAVYIRVDPKISSAELKRWFFQHNKHRAVDPVIVEMAFSLSDEDLTVNER